MPFGHFLMGLASVQSIMANLQDEALEAKPKNWSTLRKFINWAINTSSDPNFILIEGKENVNTGDIEVTTQQYNSTTPNYFDHNADSLSIMWYLASFGALVLFFLLISFSEVCCKKSFSSPPEDELEVAPPPYDLFAPPTYDSLYEEKKEKSRKKKRKRRKCEIFVIPVFGDKSSSRVAPLHVPREMTSAVTLSVPSPAPP